MNNFFQKIKKYIIVHKITSAIVAIVIIYAGYWGYGKLTSTAGETRYIVADVQKGTLVASITGSGQVSTSNQIDLKPKASGDITYIGVNNGQEVKAGALVAQMDATDAQKAVRDAEVNLESAKISLSKLTQPADTLSLVQTENALGQAQSDLEKSYDDGFTDVSNAFLSLPDIVSGLADVVYGTTVNKIQSNADAYANMAKTQTASAALFKDDVFVKYKIARVDFDQNFIDYRVASRASSKEEIEAIINETYSTTKAVADALKSMNDLLGLVKDDLVNNNISIPAILLSHQNSLSSYMNSANSHLSTLLNIKNSMTSLKYSVIEKTDSLAKLKAGADALDIESANLSIKQRENALRDAQENLANYFIRAPFGGTIAKLNVKKYDPVGSVTSVATLITKQKIAEVSLNEVDAAKIKVGQKATLTFDAVSGLGIAGEVAEIDTVGTVSQGVVSYTVKISFDTQDDRVKSGMSVSASIITDARQDVLLAPNSAVKTQGNSNYVEIFDPKLTQTAGNQNSQGVPSTILPKQQIVEAGLSNDTQTEIVSGVKEGDQIVVRTISAQTTTATAPSLFGGGGGGMALGR